MRCRSPQPGRGTRVRTCARGRPLARLPLAILTAGALLLAAVPRVGAQAPGLSGNHGLRVEWTVDRANGPWQSVCGYLYNETARATREVQLLVEARDTSGRVIDSRHAWVLGYVSPRGRTYFCSAVAAGAARHSVTIVAVQWSGGDR